MWKSDGEIVRNQENPNKLMQQRKWELMLYKRYFRELKRNPGIYLAIFIILSIGLGTVFGGNAGDDSMIAKR